MKLFHIILLLIYFPAYDQSNFLGPAKYSIPGEDFIAQFSNTSNFSRIYCFNKKGKKVWLTNVSNYVLTFELKGTISQKLQFISAEYNNGIIEGVQLNPKAFKSVAANILTRINFPDVSSITLQSDYSIESPYFDFDSCKRIWQWKRDSLAKHYSGGKELVLYFIPKNNSKADSLLIYENACYNINFKDNVHVKYGVVQKITLDSIYISNSFDGNTAKANKEEYTILQYALGDILELSLLKGGGYSYKSISASDYHLMPLEVERNKLTPPCWFKIKSYSGNVVLYRAYLMLSGFAGVMEENGKIYWYEQ